MEKLPTEIEQNILDRLPIEEALLAKRVCKTWKILLRCKTAKVGLLFAFTYKERNENKLSYGDQYDHILGKMSYNYSYDRLDTMPDGKILLDFGYIENIIGSCNGLVCFAPKFGKPFLICNPFTGDVVYVPRIRQNYSWSWTSGFGYSHSTNEYKIVTVQSCEDNKCQILVYTLGGGCGWRCKGSNHINPVDIAAGTYANGAIYWLQPHDKIVAFDLEDESFQVTPFPPFKNVRYKHHLKLLGGNYLYLVCTFHMNDEPCCMDIWAYKRKNTNTTNGCTGEKRHYDHKNLWHWIKQFSIKLTDLWSLENVQPLAITQNEELLMCYRYKTVHCYDFKTSTMNKLFNGHATGCDMVKVIPHVNSIVSIPKRSQRGSRSSVMLQRFWGAYWKLQQSRSSLVDFLFTR